MENFWHGAPPRAGETAFDTSRASITRTRTRRYGYTCGKVACPQEGAGLSDEVGREVILQLKTGTLDSVYFQVKFRVTSARSPAELSSDALPRGAGDPFA